MSTRATRNAASLDILRRSIERLGGGSMPAALRIHVMATVPHGDHLDGVCVADMSVPQLAEHLTTALYGRLEEEHQAAAAEDDSNRFDGLHTVLEAYTQLQAAPWFPPQEGDLVHIAYQATETVSAWGETYLVWSRTDGGPGEAWQLSLIHHTAQEPADAGMFAPGPSREPLLEIWTEAGPQRVTVVRGGVVVHDGPAGTYSR